MRLQSGAFRSQCGIELASGTSAAAVREALRRLVTRHEILRTGFRSVSGLSLPVQVIAPEPAYELEVERWEDLGGLLDRLAGERDRPYEPASPVSLRAALIELPADRRLLVMTLPALVADGRSLRHLADEVATLAAGGDPGEDPVQYADLTEWLNEVAEEEVAGARAYWRAQLGGAGGDLELPLERAPRAAGDLLPFAPAGFVRRLAPAAVADLAALAAERGGTLSDLLRAALQILLGRLTGRPEIVLGALCDGRAYEPLQGAVGAFSRFVPALYRSVPEMTFAELLSETSRAVAQAAAWQDSFRWEEPAERSEPPYFAVCFESVEASFGAPAEGLRLHGWHSCTDRFRLKLAVAPGRPAADLLWQYDPERFDRAYVEAIADQMAALLCGIVLHPHAVVAELPLLDPAERQRLTVGAEALEVSAIGSTRPTTAGEETVLDRFAEQVRRAPEEPALLWRGEAISYRDLAVSANRLAHRLRRLGVARGSVVGLRVGRSPAMVQALLAIWKLGAAYLALDPDGPASAAAELLATSRVRLLLTEEGLRATLPPFAGTVLSLDGDLRDLAAESAEAPDGPPLASDLAYVAATSGSTATPKGVLCHHRGVLNFIGYLATVHGLGPGQRVLQIPGLWFDASVRDLVGPLATGATVVLMDSDEARSPAAQIASIDRHQVSALLSVVPTLLRELLDMLERREARCPSVRLLLLSGEPLFAADCARARRAFAGSLCLANQYGPTECTMISTCHRIDGSETGAVPLGRPIPNARLYLLDERFEPVPVGVAGEIFLAGAGLAYGYLERPDLAAAGFLPNPWSEDPGDRFYRTGDLARRRLDGTLEFLGRRDLQVKVRGVRVELEGVAAAVRQVPGVRQAAVLAWPAAAPADAAHAADAADAAEVRLVAYVVSEPERRPAVADLRRSLGVLLPSAMLPGDWIFLDALPVTRTGKVDRRALPPPSAADREPARTYVAPRTAVEARLAEIWSGLLGGGRVGIDDDFFESGGHSLLAARLVAEACEVFGVEIPLRALFDAPTVAGLAQRIEDLSAARSGAAAPPLRRADRTGVLPLSFVQERMWFLERLAGEPMNVPGLLRLRGRLDKALLRRSLGEVVRRHEALRTNIGEIQGRPVLRIAEAFELAAPVVDLSSLEGERREQESRRLSLEQLAQPADWAAPTLLRVALVQAGADEHLLLASVHHIMSDRVSMEILLRDLVALYGAGPEAPPPPSPIQFADFASWQREWMRGEVLERHVSFWTSLLSAPPPVFARLVDQPGTLEGLGPVEEAPVALGPETTSRLKALARERHATLFMVLVALFHVVLRERSESDDVLSATYGAGRLRHELNDVIGCFASHLAVRTRLTGELTFGAALERVRASLLDAQAHQGLPFEKLGELAPQLNLAHARRILIVLDDGLLPAIEVGDLRLESPAEDAVLSAGPAMLRLTMRESAGALSGRISYSSRLLSPASIHRLGRQLEAAAAAVAADPESSLTVIGTALREIEEKERSRQESELEEVGASRLRDRRRARAVGGLV